MKRLAQLVAALAVPCIVQACAAPLATLPPSDTYKVVEGDAPQLTEDELNLVADVNAELERLGLPPATPGAYEQNAATVMANAALAKLWAKSGRALTKEDDQVIQAPVSGEVQAEGGKKQVAAGRMASLTDETEDVGLSHLHTSQRLIARGMPSGNMRVLIISTPYAQTRLGEGSRKRGFSGRTGKVGSSIELIKLVRSLRPEEIHGQLMIGAVVLPAGDADSRIFAVAIRDRTFDLTSAPPRLASPGQSFEVAGTVVEKDVRHMKVGMLGPDGQTKLGLIPVDAQGKFTATLTLPSAAGLYVVSLATERDGYADHSVKTPVFAGVPLSPWPVSADPKATPVDGTHSIAQRMAKALVEFRKSHGLPALPIDATLSAFAKNEAVLHAKAADQQSAEKSGTPQAEIDRGFKERLAQAGYDPEQISRSWNISGDDYMNDYFARFPDGPTAVADLASPTAQQFGIGVALVPDDVTKDSDLVRYSIVWMVKDPNRPKPEAPAVEPAPAVAAATAPAASDSAPAAAAPASPASASLTK